MKTKTFVSKTIYGHICYWEIINLAEQFFEIWRQHEY